MLQPELGYLMGNEKKAEFYSITKLMTKPQLFPMGPIDPADLRREQAMDGYFMASLATLAEYPHLLPQLLTASELSPDRIYTLILNLGGMPTPLTLND